MGDLWRCIINLVYFLLYAYSSVFAMLKKNRQKKPRLWQKFAWDGMLLLGEWKQTLQKNLQLLQHLRQKWQASAKQRSSNKTMQVLLSLNFFFFFFWSRNNRVFFNKSYKAVAGLILICLNDCGVWSQHWKQAKSNCTYKQKTKCKFDILARRNNSLCFCGIRRANHWLFFVIPSWMCNCVFIKKGDTVFSPVAWLESLVCAEPSGLWDWWSGNEHTCWNQPAIHCFATIKAIQFLFWTVAGQVPGIIRLWMLSYCRLYVCLGV